MSKGKLYALILLAYYIVAYLALWLAVMLSGGAQ